MNDNIQYIYEVYASTPDGSESWPVHLCATEEIAKYLVAWEEAIQYDTYHKWFSSYWDIQYFKDHAEIKFGIREQELILK
jgi:hypothetical protein